MIADAMANGLRNIEGVELNLFKKIEMYYKFRQFVPQEHHGDVLYAKPQQAEVAMAKKEKVMRKEFRGKIVDAKRSAVEKKEFTKLMEAVASRDAAVEEEV